MILHRLGNKMRIAEKILPHFPKHDIYIEMFFGAGGMFFKKEPTKHTFVNDLDDDVYNFWAVISNHKEEFLKEFSRMPISNTLFQHWRKNQETNNIRKAVRFLLLSNFGYMGQPTTMKFGTNHSKQVVLNKIDKTFELIQNVYFLNFDFRQVLKKIQFRGGQRDKDKAFIYADPPYLGTGNNYKNNFTINDTIDLFEILISSNIKFAISEFENDIVMDLAKQYNLNTIEIGERQNLKNRKTEILITNY